MEDGWYHSNGAKHNTSSGLPDRAARLSIGPGRAPERALGAGGARLSRYNAICEKQTVAPQLKRGPLGDWPL
jgi:hypothetical protein